MSIRRAPRLNGSPAIAAGASPLRLGNFVYWRWPGACDHFGALQLAIA